MRKLSAGVVAGAMGLVVALGVTGSAVAAKKPKKRAFTQTDLGAQIFGSGTSFQSAYKVKDSLEGNGASVQVGTVSSATTFPLSGTSKTTTYFANGVARSQDTFTLSAPTANISTITGTGKCLGGTGVHKKEKCSYSFTGTYNTMTTVTTVTAKGTDTQ